MPIALAATCPSSFVFAPCQCRCQTHPCLQRCFSTCWRWCCCSALATRSPEAVLGAIVNCCIGSYGNLPPETMNCSMRSGPTAQHWPAGTTGSHALPGMCHDELPMQTGCPVHVGSRVEPSTLRTMHDLKPGESKTWSARTGHTRQS